MLKTDHSRLERTVNQGDRLRYYEEEMWVARVSDGREVREVKVRSYADYCSWRLDPGPLTHLLIFFPIARDQKLKWISTLKLQVPGINPPPQSCCLATANFLWLMVTIILSGLHSVIDMGQGTYWSWERPELKRPADNVHMLHYVRAWGYYEKQVFNKYLWLQRATQVLLGEEEALRTGSVRRGLTERRIVEHGFKEWT